MGKRFVILSALLLGIIGGVSGIRIPQMASSVRPEFPSDTDGCTPGKQATASCPPRTECFKDSNYPNGGRCDCTPNWFKIQKDLPFDDSEWSPPFTENSCESLHFMRAILFILYLVVFSSFAASAFTDFVVIRELVNVNAFKNNATGRSLVALGIISVGWMCSNLLYFANLVDLDKLEYWYSSRPVIYTYWTLPLGFLVDFEIGITWIDLYDRTNKMSKNSSQAVKILRIVTRLLSAVVIIIFFWLTGLGTQWGMIGTLIIPPVIGGIYVFVGSKLIVKTLCPDRKDTANPNWKVTEAIRRGARQNIASQYMMVFSALLSALSNRHPQFGYTYSCWPWLYHFWLTVRMWSWNHYLIFGSRKHLKKYANAEASAYFGFSTIGLNKTLTSASSVVGLRSSVVSSKSSAVEQD